jgi:cell division septum initiation protein DivIVA
MNVIVIPRELSEKLGDEASNALVGVIREIDFDARKDAIAIVEERFERRLSEESGKLRVEIEKLRTEIKIEIAELRAEMKTEIAGLRAEMKTEIAGLRAEMKSEIAGLRAEMKSEIAGLRAEIKTEMSSFKAEMIKWMFLFWVGQMVSMVALFKFFAK